MTERRDEQPDHPTDLEGIVDRLDKKAAEEHGSETLARESRKSGSPDEPDEPPD